MRKCIDPKRKKSNKLKSKEEDEDIRPPRRSKVISSPQTKSKKPGRSKKNKEINEQNSIEVKNEIPLDDYTPKVQNIDYEPVKKEDVKSDEFQTQFLETSTGSVTNDNDDFNDGDSDYNNDNDWGDGDGDDFTDNIDNSPPEKKTLGRKTRNSVKRSIPVEPDYKNCEEEEDFDHQDDDDDDDFEWNMDNSSDKDGQIKRRRSSRGPPFICKRCDLSYEVNSFIFYKS